MSVHFRVDPTEFADKRVVVTGGTMGAGEAIVKRFVRAGARVATAARNLPEAPVTGGPSSRRICRRRTVSPGWRSMRCLSSAE